MKKLAKNLLFIFVMFMVTGCTLVACGNPYKNLKMEISSSSVEYNEEMKRNEFVLTSSSSTFTLTAKVTGGDSSIDRRVDISIEQPSDVIEFLTTDGESISHSGEETSASFVAKNGGYATINFISKEGGLKLTYKVFVVIPINELSFKNDTIPILKGRTTNITEELLNESSAYDYLTFVPANTNQKDSIKFEFVNNTQVNGVTINGTKITISENSNVDSFQLVARYKNEAGEEKVTNSATFKVLSPFDMNKLQIQNLTLAEKPSLEYDKANGYYKLKLSTNYADSLKASLAFMYNYGNETVNALDYLYISEHLSTSTKYSIKTEREKNSSVISSPSNLIDVSKVSGENGGVFNIVHKNIIAPEIIKFYVNFLGYEEYFQDLVISMQVEVSPFPEDIGIYETENGKEIKNADTIYVYNTYTNGLVGTPIFISVLGPDKNQLDLEKFTCEILDDNSELELVVRRGATYEKILNGAKVNSGTQLYLRTVTKSTSITECRIRFKSVTMEEISKEINVRIVPDDVKWSDIGDSEATIYLNFLSDLPVTFNFMQLNNPLRNPSWINIDGQVDARYADLKIDNFKFTNSDNELVEISNKTLTGFDIKVTKIKLGNSEILVQTPNGYVFKIKVLVLMNLKSENLVAELGSYSDKDLKEIKEIGMYDDNFNEYSALVGNKQTVAIKFNENGNSYLLDINRGYTTYRIISSAPESVLVQGKNIIAKNISAYKTQIEITIRGYSWEDDNIDIEPTQKEFKFRFYVHVKSLIGSVKTTASNPSIFTLDTLNIEEREKKGITKVAINIAPIDVKSRYEVTWNLLNKLNGESLLPVGQTKIDKNNMSGEVVLEGNLINIVVNYSLSSDFKTLTLYTRILNDSSANKYLDFSSYFYVYAYVTEQYEDFYGNTYQSGFSNHTRITVANAKLVSEIIPDVALNRITFDKRVLDVENETDSRIYFVKNEKSMFEFSYVLNPLNPENKTIVAQIYDASIEVEVDSENQVVKVWIVSLPINESYVTPSFNLRLCALDSAMENNDYRKWIDIQVVVQDGLEVPYEISTEEDLLKLSNNASAYSQNYVLVNNITLSNSSFKPIGSLTAPFTGSFVGSTRFGTIPSISIELNNTEELEFIGLFGVIQGAKIADIAIKNIKMNINTTNENAVIGSLVGLAIQSRIENVFIDDGNSLENLSGQKIYSIQNNQYGINLNIGANSKNILVGGLAGAIQGGEVVNSSVKVKIASGFPSIDSINMLVGGMIGYIGKESRVSFEVKDSSLAEFDIYSCLNPSLENAENISATSKFAFGGVAGLNLGEIVNGQVRAFIYGNNNIGGVAGVNAGKITGAVVEPTIIGIKNIGGAVGVNLNGEGDTNSPLIELSLENGFAINSLTEFRAKIDSIKVQFIDNDDRFSYFNTAVMGEDSVGGLVGLNITSASSGSQIILSGVIKYSSVYSYVDKVISNEKYSLADRNKLYFGDIVIKAEEGNVAGGLVGRAKNLVLQNCQINVKFNAFRLDDSAVFAYVGGAVGGLQGEDNSIAIVLKNMVVDGYFKNNNLKAGGFIGDATGIISNASIQSSGGNITYSLSKSYKYGDENFGAYNIINSYSLLKEYGTTNVVQNFAGINEYSEKIVSESLDLVKFNRQYFAKTTVTNLTQAKTVVSNIFNQTIDTVDSGAFASMLNGYGFVIDDKVENNRSFDSWCELLSNLQYKVVLTIRIVNEKTISSKVETLYYTTYETLPSYAKLDDNGNTGNYSKVVSTTTINKKFRVPNILSLNSFYIGFESFVVIKNGSNYEIGANLITINESYAKNGNIVLETYKKQINGNYVSYIGSDLSLHYIEESKTLRCDENGDADSNGKFIKINNQLYYYDSIERFSRTLVDVKLYQDNLFLTNLIISNINYYSNFRNSSWNLEIIDVIDNETGWDKTNGKPADLDKKDYYLNQEVNNGFPIVLSKDKEKNGKVQFVVDLPPKNLSIECNFVDKTYPSEGEVETGTIVKVIETEEILEEAYDATSNKLIAKRVESQVKADEITLSYFSVDAEKLPLKFGYYDFNHDGNLDKITQNEKVFTSHINSLIALKNRYLLNDVIKAIATPSFISSSELTIKSNSNLVKIVNENGKAYLVVSGSGVAELSITSKLNTEFSKIIKVNIINAISNIDIYSDSSRTTKLSNNNSTLNIIKNTSSGLYFSISESLTAQDGVDKTLIKLYGAVPLENNNYFDFGVRFYVLANGGTEVYHEGLTGIPDGFTINNQVFKVNKVQDKGELIYIDCDNATEAVISGLNATTYSLMAVPYIKINDNTRVLIYKNSNELSVDSGDKFNINIINGTKSVSTIIDSKTNPFSPSSFETTITTDNPNAKLYIAVQNNKNEYLDLTGDVIMPEEFTFETVESIYDEFTNKDIDSFITDKGTSRLDGAKVYELPLNDKVFEGFTVDKFRVLLTSIQRFDKNHNVIQLEENYDETKYIKYSFTITVLDEYKYYISETENLKFSFFALVNNSEKYGDNNGRVEAVSFDYAINSQAVEKVTLNHYADITLQSYDVETGKPNVITSINQSFISNTLVCGQPGLLHINIHPGYSKVDTLTLNSNVVSGYSVSLEQMYANYITNQSGEINNKYLFGGYYTSLADDEGNVEVSNSLNLKQISYGYPNEDLVEYQYNGNYYVKTSIPTFSDASIKFELHLVGYADGKKVIDEKLIISPQLTPDLVFNSNGETETAIAIGTEVELTVRTNGTIDESKLFNLTVDKNIESIILANKTYSLQDEAVERYILNRQVMPDKDGETYRFYVPYNRDIIGEEFSLEVTVYKIINNNRYESKKKVSFIISEYVINNVVAERVEKNDSGEYELNGNYNQEYALKAVIDAKYVSYKDLTTKFGTALGNSADEIAKNADTILANIRKDITKLEALITSRGLFGEYISLEDLMKNDGANGSNLISTWQNQAGNFGEVEMDKTTIDVLSNRIDEYANQTGVLNKGTLSDAYYLYRSAYWKYVDGDSYETLSVEGNYNGVQITNARASRLNTGISVSIGENSMMELLEPYATLNVRVTNINTQTKLALSVSIGYGKDINGKTSVGLADSTEDIVNREQNKYSKSFDCEFGFNAIQLSNEENPEPIYTVEELKNMQAGVHYILMEDLELENWVPLNTAIASLDGNSYVLRLKSFANFVENSQTNIGLFGVVSEATILKNIILEAVPYNRNFDDTLEIKNAEGDINVVVQDLSQIRFGLIAGENQGTITNAYVTYDADKFREERDGLLGKADGIKASYYSTYKSNNPLLDNSNRTTSIIKISGNTISSSEDIRIGGVVGVNSGYITNSAIENVSIIGNVYVAGFVCENASGGKVASSYFKGGNIYNISEKGAGSYTSNGTAGFAIFNSGEINYSYVYGRGIVQGEFTQTPNISGVTGSTELENGDTFDKRYVGLKYTYNEITNGTSYELNKFLNSQTDTKLTYTNILNQRAVGSVINSAGNASGFIYSNSGVVSNSYSNILILASGSSGFVFANGASASINNSFTLSSVQTNDTYHKPFTGVIFEGSTSQSLNEGKIENSYYMQVNKNDYQQLFDIFSALYSHKDDEGFEENYGKLYVGLQEIFLTTGQGGKNLQFVVNQEKLWSDPFGSGDSTAIGLSSVEFAAYTSFATYSFNSDYAENGTKDPEKLARAVWFIPDANNNEASENKAIANYFKHNSYTSRVPELVSANLKTMSLRKANFIPQLPSNSDIKAVLETLASDMGYIRVKSRILEATTNDGVGYPDNGISNKEIFIGLIGNNTSNSIEEDENRSCGYATKLGEAIIDAYITVKNPLIKTDLIISGNNTVQNIMNNYFINGITYTGSIQGTNYKELSDKDILEILLVAVNSINAIDENSESSYTYSYVQENSKGVNIIYGESVLNPYLITSASKFNIYSLQINNMGEETTVDQDAYLRFVKDIYFDNVLESVKTYKLTFRGDLEGNGMTIQDLKIVAENEKVKEEAIEEIGLFKVLKGEEDGLRGSNVRNLNLDINTISATAVKYVGALAGRIEGGDIENIQILGDENSLINGFNATGGLAGKISGDETIVTNIKSSVSIKSNMYTGPANRYSAKVDDPTHRFNLYHYSTNDEGNYISNIDEVSYAGGIAGILEAKTIDLGSDVVSNANIRSNQVLSDISLRGEVVGGLFGYVGRNSLISNSKLVVSENTRIIASAVGGGLVGHLEGDITSSEVTHENQTAMDSEIYNKVKNFDSNDAKSTISIEWGVAVGDDDGLLEGENPNLFGASNANAHYIGGLAGLSYSGNIEFSYNRVDVASINSKFAGGIVGLSIGLSLKDVYTTASVFSFISYGGLIGIQTMEDAFNNYDLLNASRNNDYYIKNWSDIHRNNMNTTISLGSVVGANLWKDSHKVVNRKTYRIDAYQAEIGSFIGRAMSYNTNSAYLYGDVEWYNTSKNPTNQRVKSESVYFMMAYAKSNSKKLILEIGNATSVKAILNGTDDLNIIGEYQNEANRENEYLVRNLTKYIMFEGSNSIPSTYAYSGDFTSKLKNKDAIGDTDDAFNYYRFSRLANYGSFRTIKEFITGKYMINETKTDGLTARIYDAEYIKGNATDNHYIVRNYGESELGEYDLTKILLDTTKTGNEREVTLQFSYNGKNSRPQNIYDNWRQDTWFGVSMSETTGTRSENETYVFPRVRTKVYEDVIYVQTIYDLVNNTANYPSKTYVLLNDIDMDNYRESWNPLNSINNPFTGVIKSYNDSTILNVRASIFECADGATFKDFNIETASGKIISAGGDNFGVLVNQANNTKFTNLNLSIIDDIATSALNAGGLVGSLTGNKSRVENCQISFANGIAKSFIISNASVNAGLVAGYVQCEDEDEIPIIANAVGNIVLNGDKSNATIGGLVGKTECAIFINGVASVNIEGTNVDETNIGGLIGYGRSVRIFNSGSACGDVILNKANNSNIGGLVGKFESFDAAGDAVDKNIGIIIQKSVSNLNIKAEDGYGNNIGGLVGYIKSNNLATDIFLVTYSAGSIKAKESNGISYNTVGGLIGLVSETMGDVIGDGINISSSYSLSKIGILKKEEKVGGIIGEYKRNEVRKDGLFNNICYVYDFIPNHNGYGLAKGYKEFTEGSLNSLKLGGTENAEWVKGSVGTTNMRFPTIKDTLTEIQLGNRNNQNVKITTDITLLTGDDKDKYSAIRYGGTVLPEDLSLENKTIYLSSTFTQSGAKNVSLDCLSVVIGLKDGGMETLVNNGIISEADVNNLTSFNGVFIKSRITTESQAIFNQEKTMYNSYMAYGSSYDYRNDKNEKVSVLDIANIDIKSFLDEYEAGKNQAKFDFEKTWALDKDGRVELRWLITTNQLWSNYQEAYDKSTGTYSIINANQLAKFASDWNNGTVANGAKVEIMADIDLTGYIWSPIGTSARPFNGTFIGNNRRISGINVTTDLSVSGRFVSGKVIGLFGYTRNAKISNLVISSGILLAGGTETYAGTLAGQNNGASNYSRVQIRTYNGTSKVMLYGETVGGIIGKNFDQPILSQCSFEGYAYGNTAGGFVGSSNSGISFSDCYISNGDITTNINARNIEGKQNVGGLFGFAESSFNIWVDGVIYISTEIDALSSGENVNHSRIAGKIYTISSLATVGGDNKLINISSDTLKTDNSIDGFRFGKIWCRVNSLNNGYPVYFDYWIYGTKMPGEDKYHNENVITDEEKTFIETIKTNGYVDIQEPSELAWIARIVNNGEYDFAGIDVRILNDLDFSSKVWASIGEKPYIFKGNLFGYNLASNTKVERTLSNLTVSDGGLFYAIQNSNIGYIGFSSTNSVSVTSIDEDSAGIIAFIATGDCVIENITNDTTLTGLVATTNVGGLIGKAKNVIFRNCENNGKFNYKSAGNIGGLAGYVTGSLDIQDCINKSDLNGINVGGLVAIVDGKVLISNSKNSGLITASESAGGLIAIRNSSAEVVQFVDCFNNNSVTGKDYVGGLAGKIVSSYDNGVSCVVNNCQNTGRITGSTYVAGLIGFIDAKSSTIQGVNGEITNTGSINANGDYSGSIVASIKAETIELTNLNNIAKVTSKGSFAGGIIGFVDCSNSLIANNIANAGDIEVSNSLASYVGGIFGFVGTEIIANEITGNFTQKLYSSGSQSVVELNNITNSGLITANNYSFVGGMAGVMIANNVQAVDILNSRNVTGLNYVGGLFGYVENLTLSGNTYSKETDSKYNDFEKDENNNYLVDDATGLYYISGEITINNYYQTLNKGNIKGNNYVGGFIGFGMKTSIVGKQVDKSVYYLRNMGNVEGYANVGGIIGKLNHTASSNDYFETISVETDGVVSQTNNDNFNANFNYENNGLKYLVNNGNITAREFVGGIAGDAVSINEVVANYASISLLGDASYVGGLFGSLRGKLNVAKNFGDIINEEEVTLNNIGGLLGYLEIYGERKQEAGSFKWFYYGVTEVKNIQNIGSVTVETTNSGALIGKAQIANSTNLFEFKSKEVISQSMAGNSTNNSFKDVRLFGGKDNKNIEGKNDVNLATFDYVYSNGNSTTLISFYNNHQWKYDSFVNADDETTPMFELVLYKF